MSQLRRFWRGDVVLADAFWIWTVTFGLLVNVSTSVLFLILIMEDFPWMALLIGYGVSLSYNVVAIVGVWRSADRYRGPAIHANVARGSTILLMMTLSLF